MIKLLEEYSPEDRRIRGVGSTAPLSATEASATIRGRGIP